MAKKEEKEKELTFNPKKALKQPNDNIRNLMGLAFKMETIPYNKKTDVFREVKQNILSMPVDGCLTVTNKGTGMSILDVQKRISFIACVHKRKFVEKNFRTEKVNEFTVRIYRLKDKTI